MVLMTIVGGVTISLVGCLNATDTKLFNALHKHLILFYACVCDWCGCVIQEV